MSEVDSQQQVLVGIHAIDCVYQCSKCWCIAYRNAHFGGNDAQATSRNRVQMLCCVIALHYGAGRLAGPSGHSVLLIVTEPGIPMMGNGNPGDPADVAAHAATCVLCSEMHGVTGRE